MPASGQVFVGTSGFSYTGWRGSFYPKGLKATDMLGYYAGRLRTVEVNTTFYRTQPEDVVAGWVAAVPPDFRFAVKAHRRITHNRRMPNLEEAVRVLALEAAGFGERLGPLLFQFPPTAPFDESRLPRIVPLLPGGWRVAFQFRHRSWHTPEVANLIERMGGSGPWRWRGGAGSAWPRRLHLPAVATGDVLAAAAHRVEPANHGLPGGRPRRLRLFQA